MLEFMTTTTEQYFYNRLADILHSRYLPGITIKYRHLYSSLKTVSHTKQLFQYMYLVTEKSKDGQQLYVDIKLHNIMCMRTCWSCM